MRETEDKLETLQSKRSDKSALILTPEQEKELDRFQEEKVSIRKQLRQVRAGLDAEIKTLGTELKNLEHRGRAVRLRRRGTAHRGRTSAAARACCDQ